MTKLHTPGPWTERDCEVQAPDGSAICEMLSRGEDTPKWGRPHADANSRLICAAPATLAAMRKAYRMLVSRNSHPVISDNLAAAIHAASGPMHCDTCKSTGYVQYADEYGPCEDCFDGREIAEEEERT